MKSLKRLKAYFLVMLFLWSVLIVWHVQNQYSAFQRSIINIATEEANLTYQKDSLYRKWIASKGGVYVPISKKTPPNPYLEHLTERDIISTNGQKLTLINPAYMTRQVFEMAGKEITQGHLTSCLTRSINQINGKRLRYSIS
jgi:uncharacterized protein YrrD